MTCYCPIKGWRSVLRNSQTGRRSFTTNYREGGDLMTIACGQCIGCRLERSRQWAVRMMHEASLYEDNCFLTLTYAPEHLPYDNSLNVVHFQQFMKRFRKKYGKMRYFHCGEYGENYGRPHYHAIIFGFDFSDKILWNVQNDQSLFVSESLSKLWPYGHCTIGSVTFESAAYVARYVVKKITGEAAEEHYQWVDSETGEIHQRTPEYTTMSRRPGIGKGWIDKHLNDVYPFDEVIVRAKSCRPPRFYDLQYEHHYPDDYEVLKDKRACNAQKFNYNQTDGRLRVRMKVRMSRTDQLKRSLQ